jgi:hypothetical protein
MTTVFHFHRRGGWAFGPTATPRGFRFPSTAQTRTPKPVACRASGLVFAWCAERQGSQLPGAPEPIAAIQQRGKGVVTKQIA